MTNSSLHVTGSDTIIVDDDADLEHASCGLCAGTLRVVDASTGESSPCSSCFSASSASTTRKIVIQTPETVGRTVAGELAAADEDVGSSPSPLACLSKWVIEYLDAERVLRVVHAKLFSGATRSDHDDALARVCSAEVTLRRALETIDPQRFISLGVDIERERMDLIEAVAKLPGVDLTSHSALCDALISYGLRRRNQEGSSSSSERVGSRILGSIGRAWGRLRRGWEPE